ncbi:MAG: hypothetical protein MZV64_26130 [Ignavibacteriales bacterium]|nr:hypothetical protein [Ignavibacteriales bacterium]
MSLHPPKSRRIRWRRRLWRRRRFWRRRRIWWRWCRRDDNRTYLPELLI